MKSETVKKSVCSLAFHIDSCDSFVKKNIPEKCHVLNIRGRIVTVFVFFSSTVTILKENFLLIRTNDT